MGFFRGLAAPFRGAAYVLRNGYTRYLVLPLIIDLILAVATMFAAYHYSKAELGEWLTHWPWLGGLLLVVTTSLAGVVLFLIAQPLLLAAFADTLSERVERDVLGTAETVPFVSSVGKSIVHGLIKVVFYGLALAISAVLFATTGGVGVSSSASRSAGCRWRTTASTIRSRAATRASARSGPTWRATPA